MATPTFLKIASRSVLEHVKLPKKTVTYSPVPHKKVIDLTLQALDKAGIEVLDETYSSARNGRQATGRYKLAGGGDKEMLIELAWINSYDKSIPLGCAIGSNVIVCGNGMIRGDMGRFKRKHTGEIITEFEESIFASIDKAGETFKQLQVDRDKLKEITVTKRLCAELIGRMHIEQDIITATQVGIMKKELEHPTFDYKADGTAWQLYNHATVALKESHPQFHLAQHMDVHNFFTKEFSLA